MDPLCLGSEETELRALLKVSMETKRADKVYEMMQRLRATVRQVSEDIAEVIENWFRSKTAEEIGLRKKGEGLFFEKLVSIDIDPRETENFVASLTRLACERKVKADFLRFQEWLERHGPFDAVIDAANVGMGNQGTFNFFEVNRVVKKVREPSTTKKLPLIILHRSRVARGPALKPNNINLLESWRKSGALYATPSGSNDDWY